MIQNSNLRSIRNKFYALKDVEIHTLTTLIPDFITVTIVGAIIVSLMKLTKINLEDLNIYPNYLFMYFVDLFAPSFGILLVIASYLKRKPLRRAILEEFKKML
jgi:hypothetical protein